MASKDRKKETLKARYDGVVEFDQDKAVECPVPEGLQCSDALYAGLDLLRPQVIGTLEATELELDLALPRYVAIHS